MKALQLLHILVITLTACSGLPQRQGYFANNPGYASGGPWHRRQTAPVAPISTLENIFKNFLASAFPQSPANRQLAAASALIPIVAAGATATAAITTTVAVDQSNQRAAKEKEVQEKNTMLSNLDTNLKTREKEVTDLKKAMTTADTKSKEDIAKLTNKDEMCATSTAPIEICKPDFLAVCKKDGAGGKGHVFYDRAGKEKCASGSTMMCADLNKPVATASSASTKCPTPTTNVPICTDAAILKASVSEYECDNSKNALSCYELKAMDNDNKMKICPKDSKASSCASGGDPTLGSDTCNGEPVEACYTGSPAAPTAASGKCSDETNKIPTKCTVAGKYPGKTACS